MTTELDDRDIELLRRCLELTAEALADGEGPFGSVLTDRNRAVLAEGRNSEKADADFSSHPEFRLADGRSLISRRRNAPRRSSTPRANTVRCVPLGMAGPVSDASSTPVRPLS